MSGAHRFDLLSLRLFIATADMGAIARAADAYHIAPSALSKRMAHLEQLVGAALFFRRQRGIELTPAGQVLARHAHVWLAQRVLRGHSRRCPPQRQSFGGHSVPARGFGRIRRRTPLGADQAA